MRKPGLFLGLLFGFETWILCVSKNQVHFCAGEFHHLSRSAEITGWVAGAFGLT